MSHHCRVAINIQRSFEAPLNVEEADRRLSVIMKWLGYRPMGQTPARVYERGSELSFVSLSRRGLRARLDVDVRPSTIGSKVGFFLNVNWFGQFWYPSDKQFFEAEISDAEGWITSLEVPTMDREGQNKVLTRRAIAINGVGLVLLVPLFVVTFLHSRNTDVAFAVSIFDGIPLIAAVGFLLGALSLKVPQIPLKGNPPTMGPPVIQTLNPEGGIEG